MTCHFTPSTGQIFLFVVAFFKRRVLKRFRFQSKSELGEILPKERFRIMTTDKAKAKK